jgi:hypothetical protein
MTCSPTLLQGTGLTLAEKSARGAQLKKEGVLEKSACLFLNLLCLQLDHLLLLSVPLDSSEQGLF